uniref:Coiled-coil domain-containing protein 176 n=1 Tax=Rhabditophanes sp. KR3021 TaxID=114890 RepID=A0AC35TVA7_9BILA
MVFSFLSGPKLDDHSKSTINSNIVPDNDFVEVLRRDDALGERRANKEIAANFNAMKADIKSLKIELGKTQSNQIILEEKHKKEIADQLRTLQSNHAKELELAVKTIEAKHAEEMSHIKKNHDTEMLDKTNKLHKNYAEEIDTQMKKLIENHEIEMESCKSMYNSLYQIDMDKVVEELKNQHGKEIEICNQNLVKSKAKANAEIMKIKEYSEQAIKDAVEESKLNNAAETDKSYRMIKKLQTEKDNLHELLDSTRLHSKELLGKEQFEKIKLDKKAFMLSELYEKEREQNIISQNNCAKLERLLDKLQKDKIELENKLHTTSREFQSEIKYLRQESQISKELKNYMSDKHSRSNSTMSTCSSSSTIKNFKASPPGTPSLSPTEEDLKNINFLMDLTLNKLTHEQMTYLYHKNNKNYHKTLNAIPE